MVLPQRALKLATLTAPEVVSACLEADNLVPVQAVSKDSIIGHWPDLRLSSG